MFPEVIDWVLRYPTSQPTNHWWTCRQNKFMFQGWHFLHARSLLNLLSCNLPCKTWGAGFPGCGLTPGIRARDDTAYHAYHGNIYLRCFLWYKRVGICKFPRGKFSRFFSLPVTNSSHLKMNENSMAIGISKLPGAEKNQVPCWTSGVWPFQNTFHSTIFETQP